MTNSIPANDSGADEVEPYDRLEQRVSILEKEAARIQIALAEAAVRELQTHDWIKEIKDDSKFTKRAVIGTAIAYVLQQIFKEGLPGVT